MFDFIQFFSHFIPVFAIWISLCSEFLFSINGNVFRKLSSSPDKGGTHTFSSIVLCGQRHCPLQLIKSKRGHWRKTNFLESRKGNTEINLVDWLLIQFKLQTASFSVFRMQRIRINWTTSKNLKDCFVLNIFSRLISGWKFPHLCE